MELEYKRERYPVLVIGSTRDVADNFACFIEGKWEIDGKDIIISAEHTFPGFRDNHIFFVFKRGYGNICLYVKKEEDLKVLLPYVELYATYPIKFIAHESTVTVPSDFAPDIPRCLATREDLGKLLIQESDKLQKKLLEVFKTIDKDSSSYLDADEFMLASKELGKEITKEKSINIVRKMDTDGDGKVSFQEFSFWWESGQKLFGLSLRDVLLQKIKNSAFVQNSIALQAEAAKCEDAEKIVKGSHIGFNEDNKPGVQIILRAATFCSEYSTIQKTYFPTFTPGSLQFSLVLNVQDAPATKPLVASIISKIIKLYNSIIPSDLLKEEEVLSTVKTRGSSIYVCIEIGKGESEKKRKEILEVLGCIIPIIKISGQLMEIKLRLNTDFEKVVNDKKPLIQQILEGFAIDWKTQILKKNVDLFLALIGSLFREREVVLGTFFQALIFGTININIKLEEKVFHSMFELITKKMPFLNLNLSNLKVIHRETLIEAENSLPQLATSILSLCRNQLESFELAGITDTFAASLFAVLPGLKPFLSLD